ncbi:UbiD family decarboxylase [Carboxydothermus ferrireducens]|uniref:2,5-furandicarboxylate decarboxylase 1 n=1 Tax=Carboxydothermus ferrireducens DSM 11255 TaxID=1119529 RepID=A0ABX2R8X3_9THEO|nr:UbiD family decarboxylase [Carboxydothermus ferrireducens]NYE56548.1 2,5-furandicarboxylate decarboxylase 1 [Carboxydothermus ferrireducens DSM 11255]
MAASLRSFLEQLKRQNSLYLVKKPVNPRFELGALLKKTKGTVPMFFQNIEGYDVPAVGGIVGTRENFAQALRINKSELLAKITEAITNPGETRLLPSGPVQENVLTKGFDIGKMFPIPTFHEKDSGAFITAGIVVAKDPIYGRRFTSIRRMQLNGPNNLSILIESPGLIEQYYEFERRGQAMEVAIVLGVHPAITLSSQLSTQTFGLDKYNVASRLIGEPLPVVKCKTIDLEVPADAEIVLEGRMLPYVRHPEGPFGELMGYYGPQTMQPVVEVTAVTFRNNPIFQVIFPSSYEHKLPNALMREVVLFNHVRHVVPTVQDVHLTMAGGGRCHAIISIKKTTEGQGKQAIFAALASNKDVKHVVVVNDDVDIFDPEDVEWAIATRVQADQDVIIIPGAQGTPLEPSHNLRGVSAKMGIDATYPLAEKERFARTRIPGYERIRLEDYLTLEW